MSQTNTPSGAAVAGNGVADPAYMQKLWSAEVDRRRKAEGELAAFSKRWDELASVLGLSAGDDPNYAFDAVAALIARNAELEAENKALREVTDAMVERALIEWFHEESGRDDGPETGWAAAQKEFEDGGEHFRIDMHKALTAALARTPAAKGDDDD